MGTSAVEVDNRDDAALIDAIAQSKDHAAFNELLRRYERVAYGLAMRITGNREWADETVQKAMICVWSSAASYRGTGQVKAWVLSIVARKAITTIRCMKGKSPKM